MRLRYLEAEMWLPLPIDKVFAFFSDAGNLEALTPKSLQFRILTPQPISMSAGTLIDYQLRLRLIPIRWQSEIVVWNPPHQFADQQRRGPYKIWKHRHDFAASDGGTCICDMIEYWPRGGILAPLIDRWFVEPDLRTIFAYRQRRIRELLAPQSVEARDRIVFR